MISAAGKGTRLAGHHECNLEKWYDENRRNFNHMDAFVKLEETHRSFTRPEICWQNNAVLKTLKEWYPHLLIYLQAFIEL
ncbi:hypothetical protein D2962_01630 [Biomaibacter acetigenes]|uniref:Uncharacterized protein n=1 Tax=Biomaibacter acetigenes TaxID=2316383 RepID=A0A3G2R204_9FIRM|nr:hypothetical protein D2962_01630 [Biomaibacter acetigenes]RKL61526.1 hypothetical protein DXT63_16245 [Thermoanaerobacteraceae bacterium SP2]